MIKNEKMIFGISIMVSIILVLLIIVFNPILSDVTLLPDKGSSWYYWKLPERDNLTMVIVWFLFIVHLIGNFYLIRKRVKIKNIGLHKYNLYLLFFNLFCILLHFLQTAIFYDGLAQDTPIWSSQYSVIIILIILLVMQMKDRGIFLGKKIKIPSKANKFIFKWHGILFVTALVYTFWYHPIVNTIGHLTGFIYMFLLLIQVSFIKSKIHYNMKWVLLLEVAVAIHGASVAYFVQNSELWSMFFFGFLFIFFYTQIYSLNINKIIRIILQCGFLGLAIIYYAINGLGNIHQILWIPTIEYLGAFIIIALCFLFGRRRNKK